MLTEAEANAFIDMPKRMKSGAALSFPAPGLKTTYGLVSSVSRDLFDVDVNRGRIRLTKCSYQERHGTITVLLRLDLDGPPHENPDGGVVPSPHLHVYREGFGDKWAQTLPEGKFTNTKDLLTTLAEFLRHLCHVSEIPPIQQRMV